VISEDRNNQTYSNAHFRNNLFLGTDAPGRMIAVFSNATAYSTYDYDGFRPNRGSTEAYLWIAPRDGQLRDYQIGAREGRRFRTLADLAAATSQESHGVELDYDIFEKVTPPDPKTPHAVYRASDFDFRLRSGSKAIDAGIRLPNINDDCTGKAPDLGAYELGRPLPVYGPRDGSGRAAFR
jgi:hypothetical protein